MKDQTAQSSYGHSSSDQTASDNRPNFRQKISTHKKYLFLLVTVFLFILASIIYIGGLQKVGTPVIRGPQPTPRTPRVEDQVILKFKQGVSEQTKTKVLEKYNATIIERIDAINRVVVRVPTGQGDIMLEQMKKDNLIEEAEPDYLNEATFIPNDPSLNVQWGLINTGQVIKSQQGTAHADINVQPAWDVTKGNGVKIAILDTGIDMNHPDLKFKIRAGYYPINNSCSSPTECIDDKFGHGTHVAGIAAAATNNSTGIAGTCPDCELLIVKVLDDNGSGSDSNISKGVIWAADQGAQVINMSLSGPYSTTKQDMVNYAWNKGSVIVAAAGNKGNTNQNYPAANNNVVSVAATDNNDQKASFSSYGSWVDVAAPGKAIYSTVPTHSYNMQTKTPSLQLNYDYLNGTSMATPMVAGAVALIWSTNYGTSNTAVVNRLFETADKISGTGTYWTYGRVNVASAVSNTVTGTPSPTSQITPTIVKTPTPTPQYVTPTIYCLGSCPTTTPTPTSQPVNTPVQPSINTPIPTIEITISPTIDPCIASDININEIESSKKYALKENFLQRLLRWIIDLLNMLLRLIGQNPIPTPRIQPVMPTPIMPRPSRAPSVQPTISSNPCPSFTPTQQPTPTIIISATPVPQETITPTLTPSAAPTPTNQPTPTIIISTTLSATPTSQPAPTATQVPTLPISSIPSTQPSPSQGPISQSPTPSIIISSTIGVPTLTPEPTPRPDRDSIIRRIIDMIIKLIDSLLKMIQQLLRIPQR